MIIARSDEEAVDEVAQYLLRTANKADNVLTFYASEGQNVQGTALTGEESNLFADSRDSVYFA